MFSEGRKFSPRTEKLYGGNPEPFRMLCDSAPTVAGTDPYRRVGLHAPLPPGDRFLQRPAADVGFLFRVNESETAEDGCIVQVAEAVWQAIPQVVSPIPEVDLRGSRKSAVCRAIRMPWVLTRMKVSRTSSKSADRR